MARANRVPSDFESDPRMAKRLDDLANECRANRRGANAAEIARELEAEGFRTSTRSVRRQIYAKYRDLLGPPRPHRA